MDASVAVHARSSVSIVVAVWRDAGGLSECLAALEPQLDAGTELLIASNTRFDGARADGDERMVWLEAPADSPTPALWSRGIEQARGDLVAVTTSRFAPRENWVHEIRSAAARSEAVGIGGAIDPPRSLAPVAWATYFLRYSNYFHLDSEQIVGEIAADNAVYRREALRRHWNVIAEGFWEPDFHRLVQAEGHHLAYSPSVRVTQVASYRFATFCGQRVRHGTEFGRSRVEGRGFVHRLMRLASTPAVPFVFLTKIAVRTLRRRPRYLPQFILSLPCLIAFVGCWSVGEARGYLRG